MTFDDVFYHAYLLFRFAIPFFVALILFNLGTERRSYFPIRIIFSSIVYLAFSVLMNELDLRGNFHLDWLHPCFILIFIFGCLSVWASYKTSFNKILFSASASYAIQHFSDNVAYIVLGYIPNHDEIYVQFIVFTVFWLIIYSVLLCFIYKRVANKERIFIDNKINIAICAFTLLCVYFVSTYRMSENIDYGFSTSFFYDALLSLVIIIILFGFFEQSKLKIQNKVLETMVQKEGEQEAINKAQIDIINMKCHDFRKQMRHAVRDDIGQEEMINEINKAIRIYDANIKTGNETLDIVLTDKSIVCNQYKIQMSVIVDGEKLSFISKSDLYSLFNNALDNAIEASIAEEETKRFISVKVISKFDMIFIRIDNYTTRNIEFDHDGVPITSNEDKNIHGFGTKSIKYIAEKYHGKTKFEIEDNIFSVSITIPNQGK